MSYHIYKKVEVVNANIAKRIRAIATKDAPLNALVLLDAFAKIVGFVANADLEDLRPIWVASTPSEEG